MHNTLALLDVSGFVHAGSVNKYSFLEQPYEIDNMWVSQVTPTGGASLIFNTLASIAGQCDIVLCCDRNPIIKKEMIPGYKGNRNHKQNIEVEKKVVEYIGKQCNISVAAYDGYEADDVIYSYHQALHNDYDRIHVYTADSDLYFLVDDKTEILPTSSRAKHVTLSNYETTVIHNQVYKYNTITLGKIMFGDQTDCIPGLSDELLAILSRQIKPYFDTVPGALGQKDILCKIFEKYPSLIEQVNKVFPLLVNNINLTITEPDPQMICNWGAAIKNKNFVRRKSADFDIEAETIKIQELGLYVERET